jgi:predicted O-linked N-acetylglucosamine transferase (SPINDLY family)
MTTCAYDDLQATIAAADTLKRAGQLQEAVALYQICLDTCPDDLDLLYEQGEALLELDQLEEAADRFRRALATAPNDSASTIMLARTLHRLGKPLESLHFYRRAQRLTPHISVVHQMAGITATESDLRDEARTSFRRALEADPDNISARLCLCMLYLDMFPTTEALEKGRQQYKQALIELVASTRLDTPAAIDAAVEAAGMLTSFFLPYQGRNDRELQKIYGEWLCRVMAARFPDMQCTTARPRTGEKIRVGFVSAHFRDHSVWKIVTRGWLKHLDRSKFMLFGYHTGTENDTATAEARSYCDTFVQQTDIALMTETIMQHKPHILIYPGLAMDPHTVRLAALRLAPAQCVSWGHPNTTGMPTCDFFLSSDLMEPPDGDTHYSETLIRLPNLSVCYEAIPLPAPLPPTAIPGVNPGDFSYLCCQNLMKYLPHYDDVFPAIAAQVPNAKFIFIKFSDSHRHCFNQRMEAAFSRHNLYAADHVVFLPPLNAITYAVLNAEIDVYLDSIGWSGGNTTFESLPFNKPIVTLPGEFMRGRHTTAILKMMGVEETIAADVQDYVSIAARLGTDREWYDAVSGRVAVNKHRVYGDRICVRALEQFMEHVCGRSKADCAIPEFHTQ